MLSFRGGVGGGGRFHILDPPKLILVDIFALKRFHLLANLVLYLWILNAGVRISKMIAGILSALFMILCIRQHILNSYIFYRLRSPKSL